MTNGRAHRVRVERLIMGGAATCRRRRGKPRLRRSFALPAPGLPEEAKGDASLTRGQSAELDYLLRRQSAVNQLPE
jgi:hypothetical protein